jgi:hypothetical protein
VALALALVVIRHRVDRRAVVPAKMQVEASD